MSGPEVNQAVREYLEHTGGSELHQLWNGLEHRATVAEIRAALKRLKVSVWRSVNPWSPLGSIGGQAVKASGELGGFTRTRFTVYRLEAKP
jgi:hypothetical protein